MSGSILTLFGEVVTEEQKPAVKTKGRKKSAKEEAIEEPTPAEPEPIAEVIAPPAPVITDLFGQPIVTAPVLAVTAPEPAPAEATPAKRTRKKVTEDAIIDPTVFAEASLFDLFSGPQDLGKMAAEIQQHAAPAPVETVLEIVAAVPEPAPVDVVAETPVIEAAPEPVQEIAVPEITAAISEPALAKARFEIQAAEPVQEVIAPEIVAVTPEPVAVGTISEIPTLEIVPEPAQEVVAPEIVAVTPESVAVGTISEIPTLEIVPEPAQEVVAPEIVAVTPEPVAVGTISEIPTLEIVPEPAQEAIAPEIVGVTPELVAVETISEIHTPEVVSAPAPIEPEVQIITEVVAETPEEVIVATEEPVIAETHVFVVHSETRNIEIPAIIAEDVAAVAAIAPEAVAPIIEDVIVAPVEEVKIEVVATEAEVVVAPIMEAVASRIEVVPMEMVAPAAELVERSAPPVMEMISPATEVIVTRKKRTKKVVEATGTEPETADAAVSNNLPMDWQGHKTYYTIGEVAALFKVKTSNIRFWTNEFKLKVRTTRKGDRLYTPELVKEVRTIYHLVKERGFTLAGAKARLKTQNRKDVETVDLKHSLQQLRSQLVTIKNQLQ